MNFEKYMKKAISLALEGNNRTDPNPMVGALLVSRHTGEIIAEGFHEKAGQPHAEVNALKSVKKIQEDAVLFVTLEPCSFYGKTPPCADLIIEKGIRKVVVGATDPNPKVSENGIKKLRNNGIEVISGVCEEECRKINYVFNKHIITKLPYISLKAASTLDGKIAMPSGESKWITGEESRAFGHTLRSKYQAIAIGANTLREDNSQLTDRISPEPRHPIKILFSTNGKIPIKSNFVVNDSVERFVFAGNEIEKKIAKQLEDKGVKVFISENKIPSPKWALPILYQKGICSILVEGGGELISSFIKEDCADRLYLFLAGKVIGSQLAPGWCSELGLNSLKETPNLDIENIDKLGNDILLTASFV